MIWDALKAYLKGQIIQSAASKKRHSEKELLYLSSRILDIDNSKQKFGLLTTHQMQNLLLKSTFYEHGEKTGKLLANQPKGWRAKQLITSIHTEIGDVTLDPIKINNTFKDFYYQL